jgi:hypothetical protein
MTRALARTHEPKNSRSQAKSNAKINPQTSKQQTSGRNKVGNDCPEASLDDAALWPKEELPQC